ncbi:unnamed protein product [Ectocarpus sp. 6 AP-2014]
MDDAAHPETSSSATQALLTIGGPICVSVSSIKLWWSARCW